MIKISNQICCSFSLGDVEDFIDATSLKSLEFFEMAGNVRPILHLVFSLENERLIKYFNNGNILKVSFGINELSKEVIEFELYGDQSNKDYTLGYNVSLQAAFYKPKFTSNVMSMSHGNNPSITVLNNIAKNSGFNFMSNISKSADKMLWQQEGETTWEFCKYVWLHSYLNDKTFNCFGFDANNMYFYDVRQLVLDAPKWNFTNKYVADKNSNIVNFGQYITDNQYGATTSLVGKNLINKTFNTDTGKISNDTYSLKNFTAIDTDKVNINSYDCANYQFNITNDDFHENFVKAENQNLRNNIMYSSFSIYITTGGQFKKFKLFDTVKIDVDPKDTRLDGIAFITGIVYSIRDNKLNINLTLNKEAPSGMKGNLLKTGD